MKTLLIGIFIVLGCYGYGQSFTPQEEAEFKRVADSVKREIEKDVDRQLRFMFSKKKDVGAIRNVKWQFTKQQVKAAEKGKLIKETPSKLEYKASIGSDAYLVDYEFFNGKLVGIETTFDEEYSEFKLYVDEYEEVQKILITKYGMPDIDTTLKLKDAPSFSTGIDIAEGKIMLASVWFFENTRIALKCSGGEGRVILWVDYKYLPMEKQVKKAKEQIKADDF